MSEKTLVILYLTAAIGSGAQWLETDRLRCMPGTPAYYLTIGALWPVGASVVIIAKLLGGQLISKCAP